MATKASFTLEEWTLLRLAPSMVASGVAASDPSGLFASIKEAAAGAGGMAEALKSASSLELFSSLAADRSLPGMPDPKELLGEGSREQQMQNFKTAVLERVKAAADLVTRKATPEEATAYRKMLVEIADKAANASSEGGFLGFGGVRVSDKEKAFLAEVSKATGEG
jgi:hypothetical protein